MTYHWYSHHPDPEGCWNGLCVCHEEKYNASTVAKKNKRYGKKTGGAAKPSDSGGVRGNNLIVSQRRKQVLCSRLVLNNDNTNKICADVLNQGKD